MGILLSRYCAESYGNVSICYYRRSILDLHVVDSLVPLFCWVWFLVSATNFGCIFFLSTSVSISPSPYIPHISPMFSDLNSSCLLLSISPDFLSLFCLCPWVQNSSTLLRIFFCSFLLRETFSAARFGQGKLVDSTSFPSTRLLVLRFAAMHDSLTATKKGPISICGCKPPPSGCGASRFYFDVSADVAMLRCCHGNVAVLPRQRCDVLAKKN